MFKDRYVPARVSVAEYQMLLRLAERYGDSKSELIRQAIECLYDDLGLDDDEK